MIEISKVNKYFNRHRKNQIHVINNISLNMENTGLVALLGPSGSGKTTLLNAIGGLDKVQKGKIFINGKNVSIYGSQGQQRSCIISLKLAEAEVVYEEIGDYPILLLDDFMSELDKKRVKGFIQNIKNNQVLITTTDKINLDTMVYNLYKVDKAKVERMIDNGKV